MHRKLAVTSLALVVALALGVTAAIAGTARGASDPGVTSDSILLGGTAPLTGPASQYASIARGADAYFKYVNGRGGINGRKITYKVVDDGYNPAQSVPVTRQLVEQDKVFAVFNSLGTAQNVAVRPYLNAMKVPQLFVASGATTWGRSGSSRATRPKGGSTGSTWHARRPEPRSQCCSRTTTMARIFSAA
jgi:branched-chain amino acid transport system substrate-binding protein